jgi:hypothetical protein
MDDNQINEVLLKQIQNHNDNTDSINIIGYHGNKLILGDTDVDAVIFSLRSKKGYNRIFYFLDQDDFNIFLAPTSPTPPSPSTPNVSPRSPPAQDSSTGTASPVNNNSQDSSQASSTGTSSPVDNNPQNSSLPENPFPITDIIYDNQTLEDVIGTYKDKSGNDKQFDFKQFLPLISNTYFIYQALLENIKTTRKIDHKIVSNKYYDVCRNMFKAYVLDNNTQYSGISSKAIPDVKEKTSIRKLIPLVYSYLKRENLLDNNQEFKKKYLKYKMKYYNFKK